MKILLLRDSFALLEIKIEVFKFNKIKNTLNKQFIPNFDLYKAVVN